jgi:hypothetical protein
MDHGAIANIPGRSGAAVIPAVHEADLNFRGLALDETRDTNHPRGSMSNRTGRTLMAALAAAIALLSAPAFAATLPDDRTWLIRMVACKGNGVLMEVFLPQSVVLAPHGGMAAGATADGYYTLDLTELNKGKVLEPVHVTMSADKKFVTVDQYTRGLPHSPRRRHRRFRSPVRARRQVRSVPGAGPELRQMRRFTRR